MSNETAPAPLTARLEELLQSLPDRPFAERLRRVYAAAAQAVARLSDLDLLRYETTTVDDSPDLSLWEEMAPVIRDTVVDVNALLNVIREQFPQGKEGPGSLVGSGLAANLEARKTRDAAELLQGWMMQLAQGVTQLGEAMRNPAVMSDRWTLLAEIQRLRARFREQMGSLVYESASIFAPVTRQQVAPGYEADVKAAVMVRAIVADLARLMSLRLQKVREATPDTVSANAQQLQSELDAFGRTAAYKHLRAQDKRKLVELRGRLGPLVAKPGLQRDELVGMVEELETFVRSLSNVNQRQLLITHDREVWAGCGVRLERAQELRDSDAGGAARALAEAAASAQALYGRAPGLDTFLRKARKASLAQLTGAELKDTLDSFQGLLANLGDM